MTGVANIWALPLGLSALMLAALFWHYAGRDRRAREAYADEKMRGPLGLSAGGRKTTAYRALVLLALVLGTIGAARPLGPPDKDATGAAAMDVIIALDISDSMAVMDALPNRLAFAKSCIADLVEAAPGNRYGLVLFSGEAMVSCPLTADHAAFLTFLEGASFSKAGLPGSAIGEGILMAATRFKPGELPRAVLVVSDGENTYGADPVEAATSAKSRGLKVFTLGVGTAGGGRIPVGRDFFGDTQYKRDKQGKVVNSALDAATLEKIAAAADGGSFIASDSGWVGGLAKALETSDVKEVKGVPADAKECGPYFSLAAFALLAVAVLL